MTPARPLLATAAGLALAGLLTSCSQEAPSAPVPAATAAAAAPTTTSGEAPHHEHGAGSHEEVPTPAATATSSPTSTRDLPRPELPDLGKTFTQDGASSFAVYFTRVMNHARSTGDSTLLRSLSTDDCSGCQTYADEVDMYREKGYVSTGTILQFEGTHVLSWDPASGETDMDIDLSRPAHQLLAADGSLIEDVPAESDLTGYLWLKWTDDHWVVREVE
ncbi:DUF6318 family protein [Kineococcus sp. NPDC059986]|uniref:DUF6318 family protein n=1 Tax=Kineococcus sp. NPDC059986 TaxID=3155538 RepID=UPI00344D2500